MSDGTAVAGPDGALRCPWALSTPDYVTYHDEEWGRPVHGDDALFERLSLEAFQSGRSWITILRRRPGFRAAFAGFRVEKVAAFTEADRDRLLHAREGRLVAERRPLVVEGVRGPVHDRHDHRLVRVELTPAQPEHPL